MTSTTLSTTPDPLSTAFLRGREAAQRALEAQQEAETRVEALLALLEATVGLLQDRR